MIFIIIAIGHKNPNTPEIAPKKHLKQHKPIKLPNAFRKAKPTLSDTPDTQIKPTSDLNLADETPDLASLKPVTFYNKTILAKRVVYLIDNAHDMLSKGALINNNIINSISKLDPGHKFAIIFYNDQKTTSSNKNKLLLATPHHKAFVKDWLKDRFSPIKKNLNSSPIQAFKQAFAMKPDHIFLLSSNISYRQNDIAKENELLDLLKKLNPKKQTAISTIQYPAQNPKTPNSDSLIMIQISETYNGKYTFVKIK